MKLTTRINLGGRSEHGRRVIWSEKQPTINPFETDKTAANGNLWLFLKSEPESVRINLGRWSAQACRTILKWDMIHSSHKNYKIWIINPFETDKTVASNLLVRYHWNLPKKVNFQFLKSLLLKHSKISLQI